MHVRSCVRVSASSAQGTIYPALVMRGETFRYEFSARDSSDAMERTNNRALLQYTPYNSDPHVVHECQICTPYSTGTYYDRAGAYHLQTLPFSPNCTPTYHTG